MTDRVYVEGLDVFMDLFKGATNYYGMTQVCVKEPFTKEIYDDHLKGVRRVGCYPIFDGKRSHWIAVDVDDYDASFPKAIAIRDKAAHYGITMWIEKSKSKGYHIYAFFAEAVEAVKLRLVFEMILRELDLRCELFPKQDFVAEGTYGNFIFLPLFGADTIHGRCCFVDDTDKPIIREAKLLHQITKNNPTIIDEIISINELKRDTVVMSASDRGQGRGLPSYDERTLPCIENMKKGVKSGCRDVACYRLAKYYKDRGSFKEDVITLLGNWNSRNQEPLGEKHIVSVVETVWRNEYKGLGCEDGIVQQFCEKDTCPMINAKERKKQIEEGLITMTYRDASVMTFKKKFYEYRLQGFEFSRGGKFRGTLTLIAHEKILYKDIVNFDSASQRKRFIDAAKDPEVGQDIITIRDLATAQLEKEEKEKIESRKKLYVMTEDEKVAAMNKMAATPHILSEVIRLTNAMGVVGEEDVRLMVYLCFTSRIIKTPISITVKGESSSGKSFSCTNVMKLIPEEGVKFITKATQQAFYHLEENGLQHKIIYINEVPGQESADYSIRTAQSEGDLVLMMPVKDPATGNMSTVEKVVKGPAGFLSTTTKSSIFDENETRNFSVFSDDSSKLTSRIGEITIRKALGEKFVIDEKELSLWKNMQRLLNPDFNVVIPYAKEVFGSFPDKPVRVRRDRERFRVLIEVITLLHQFHRNQKQLENGEWVIYSTLADYYIAKVIAEDILTYTIYELGPAANELWQTIQELEKSHNSIHKVSSEYSKQAFFTFTHKSIAEAIDWKKDKVKKWMRPLLKSNLIEYASGTTGGKGKESVFVVAKKNQDWNISNFGFLPSVEELYATYPCDDNHFYNPVTGAKINPLSVATPEGLED